MAALTGQPFSRSPVEGRYRKGHLPGTDSDAENP